MLYPTTVDVVLAVQDRSTRCEPPDKETTVGELVALLAMETVPDALPVVVGVKVTVMVRDCPTVNVCVAVTPVAAKPDPETVT